MPFEVFSKRMIPLGNKPFVTVQRRGTISMNKAAHHVLGEPRAVELLYDREASIMGFRAAATDSEHAYLMRSTGGRTDDSGTYVLSGTAFFKYYNIDTSVSRRWQATLEDDVLCIDLSQPGSEVSSNRAGHTKQATSDDQGTLDDVEAEPETPRR